VTTFRPKDEAELAAIVGEALAREEPLELLAGGSKRGLGRPLQLPHTLELAEFSGIRLYEPEELVLTAGAATPMDEIEAALAERRQMLAFEPGDWRKLLGSEDARPTLGGAIASNLSGPRRIRQGAARDHFLGFHGVSGRGEPFKAGGRVVKNVTGYDLPKLMAGSYGTLAALTEVTLKVLPSPEATRTLILLSLNDEAARRAMSAALKSSHEVSGAAHLPAGASAAGPRTCLRLEGPEPSVAARADALRRELAEFGAIEILADAPSHALWLSVRDALPVVAPGAAVWRVSVAPTAGPALASRVAAAHDTRHFFDWGGGLVWLAVRGAEDGGAAAIRGVLARVGGHAMLVRAPDALRTAVPPFEPQAAPLAALSARVKAQFDPRRILNRGRMYRDV
jgi:glycolate oxidase FAD binding subunit